MSLPEEPRSRVEQYLSVLCNQAYPIPEEPRSRVEAYLDYLVKNGGGASGSIAPEYDATATYNKGDLTVHDKKLYEALENSITGEWDETKWAETTVAEQLKKGVGGLSVKIAWDGSGEPDVTLIPAGVTVTYNSTTYTGTLEASEEIYGKWYFVRTSDVNGYDKEYVVLKDEADNYSWKFTSSTKDISVIDNLNSTDGANALSANQGRALKVALGGKADLENGKVPLSQLPAFVIADVVEVDTYDDLPNPGQSGVVYYTKDDGKSYRWVGSQYVEISQKANYYSLTIGGDITTMGQLRTLIDNVNIAGDHVFIDLHSYLTDGYVCTVHMYTENSTNYCQILDLLYHRVIFNPSGYTDSTLISTYCSTASNIWVSPRDVRVNGTSIIENEIADIPILSSSNFGVAKVNSTKGVTVETSTGLLTTVKATDSQIENKGYNYTVIVPSNLDKAVMEGLGNNSLTWSDAYKTAARNKIGALGADSAQQLTFVTENDETVTYTFAEVDNA